jgi:hypothetical protein
MPYVIRKVRNQDCFSVKNAETGRIHAKCTTRPKAEAQVRLLSKIDSNGKQTSSKRTSPKRTSTKRTSPKRTSSKRKSASKKSPYVIRKVRNQDCFSVKNAETGRIHAKCTTKPKAEAQVRLLSKIKSPSKRKSA